MVDFRYHLVSLVAVLLALATGVVLGADLLAEPAGGGVAAERDRLAATTRSLGAQVAALQRRDAAQRRFIAEMAPALVAGKLADRSSLVVALPGADRDAVADVTALLTDSGSTVRGTVTLTPPAADPRRAAGLDDLVARIVPAGITLPEGTAWERLGAELAAVLAAPAGDTPRPVPPESATTVLSALATAGYLSVSGEVAKGAQTVVLVGGTRTEEGPRDGFVRLAQDLDKQGAGAVVLAADGARSVLDGVRRAAGDSVSTVEAGGGPASGVVAVLALAEEVQGRSAHYGADDDPPAPRLATQAAPAQ